MKSIFTKILLVSGNLICLLGVGQTYNKINKRTKTVLDSTYTTLLKKNNVVGASIAIVDKGEIVYATGYGFSDYGKKIKADEKTIYRIGSCTKSFTALSLLQLQEKELLNIKNSVKIYLPELKITSRFNDSNQIYIKDILTHTSGLPCDIANGAFCDRPPDINWVIRELNKQTTMSPRLYMAAYSNIGYGLLGEVIARVSKSSYNDYVKKNIFLPLNMSSSFIDYNEALSVSLSRSYYFEKKIPKEIEEPLIRDAGAGMISSNVLDMANYINMYLNNGTVNGLPYISKTCLDEMEKNQVSNIQLSCSETGGYGLYTKKAAIIGQKQDTSRIRIIGHSGDTYAFHSDFEFIPELNVGVIVLTNSENGGWIVSASKLLKMYLKEEKSEKLLTKDPSKAKTAPLSTKEEVCSNEELIGNYNLGQFIIPVKNERKIKFKQGAVKITFTRKKTDPKIYAAKALVFGIIPINISDQQFKFVKVNDQVYLKVVFKASKEEEYIGIKSSPQSIPLNWKLVYGNYKAIDTIFKCKDCRVLNMEGMSMEIKQHKGFILMKTKGKSKDTKTNVYLNLISDKMAVTGGIGRGTGETVKLLENGNIYYSGFEFRKVK